MGSAPVKAPQYRRCFVGPETRHDIVRKFLIVGAVIAMTALTATIALGAVTFHSGPDFTVNADGTITATGDLSGLGNQPATATITQTVTAFYTCENPGGNTAPGQDGATFTSPDSDQDLTTKNGRAILNVTTNQVVVADEVSGNVAGCPNGRWKGVDPVVTDRSATLTITQRGQVLYTETIEF